MQDFKLLESLYTLFKGAKALEVAMVAKGVQVESRDDIYSDSSKCSLDPE